MCLTLPKPSRRVKDPSRIFKKENGKLIAWKIFRDSIDRNNVFSAYLYCIAKKHYISNRKTTNLTKEEIKNREVYKGIHVYIKKPIPADGYFIIKCLCDPKDFVATEAKRHNREAVFTKVEIVPPKGYEFNEFEELVKNKQPIEAK